MVILRFGKGECSALLWGCCVVGQGSHHNMCLLPWHLCLQNNLILWKTLSVNQGSGDGQRAVCSSQKWGAASDPGFAPPPLLQLCPWKVLGLPKPALLPCSQWASSGVLPKPDPTHPKNSSFTSFIHIHEKSHCSEYPPHEDTLCWSLEWVCKAAQLLPVELFLSCYFSVFPRADLSLIYWNAGRISDNHKNILFEATSPGFAAVKLDRQFCYSRAEL